MELTKEQIERWREQGMRVFVNQEGFDALCDLALRGLGGTPQEPVAQVEPCELCGADMIHVSRASDYAAPAGTVAVPREPIGYARKQDLLTYKDIVAMYSKPPAPENGWPPVKLYSEDQVVAMLAAAPAAPASARPGERDNRAATIRECWAAVKNADVPQLYGALSVERDDGYNEGRLDAEKAILDLLTVSPMNNGATNYSTDPQQGYGGGGPAPAAPEAGSQEGAR